MDWQRTVEWNAKRLQRILAMLVAMAGLDATFTSPQGQGTWGGRREASGGGCDLDNTPTRRSDDRRPPLKGEVRALAPAMATSAATMRFNAQWFFSIARFQSIAASPFKAAGFSRRGGGVGMDCGEEKSLNWRK